METKEISELWLPVPRHEESYWVSNFGQVKSTRKILKPLLMTNGYHFVIIYKNSIRTYWSVSNLVLTVFECPRPENLVCCHNDGNKLNNSFVNLRWDTQTNNLLDKQVHGTEHQSQKTMCPRGHEFILNNINKKRTGKQCRSCVLAYTKAWYHKKKFNIQLDIEVLSDDYYDRILSGKL